MIRFLPLVVALFSVSAVQDSPAKKNMDGVYELVSSRFEQLDWSSPGWKGMMIVKDGRCSRVYQEVSPDSEISFHSNAGTVEYDGKISKMRIQFSNYRELVGVTFNNRVTWSPDRRTLTLSAVDEKNNFREVWKRAEK